MTGNYLDMRARRLGTREEPCARGWGALQCPRGWKTHPLSGHCPTEGDHSGRWLWFHVGYVAGKSPALSHSHGDPETPIFQMWCQGSEASLAQEHHSGRDKPGFRRCPRFCLVFSVMSRCPFLMAGNLDKQLGLSFSGKNLKSSDQGNLVLPRFQDSRVLANTGGGGEYHRMGQGLRHIQGL